MNYYNEFDPFAAAWLRELIKANLIPQGIVDERSIVDVKPEELREFKQCHFFAGIGGWSYALQLAGWQTDRPVWTGSCPCQPFSSAGKQKGKADERHLWPVWFRLIRECRPPTIFGEQVASAVAHGWLDDVYQGLESEGYAVGSAVLPACSVGAPHKRDRLFFVANTISQQCTEQGNPSGHQKEAGQASRAYTLSGDVGNAEHHGPLSGQVKGSDGQAIPDNTKRQDGTSQFEGASEPCDVARQWNGTWINCPDGKQRLVELEFCCMVNGLYVRVADVRRAHQHETEKGIIFYGSTNKKHRTEIMRELRNTYTEKAFWAEVAGFIGVQEAEVLQPFLLDFLSAQECFTNNSGIKEAGAENDEGQLRSVPYNEIVDSASCGWKPAKQSNSESANTLRELSFFLARCAYSCRVKTNQAHARTFPLLRKGEVNRVGKLRGYGNAIVPQVAAEFVKAYMEIIK